MPTSQILPFKTPARLGVHFMQRADVIDFCAVRQRLAQQKALSQATYSMYDLPQGVAVSNNHGSVASFTLWGWLKHHFQQLCLRDEQAKAAKAS